MSVRLISTSIKLFVFCLIKKNLNASIYQAVNLHNNFPVDYFMHFNFLLWLLLGLWQISEAYPQCQSKYFSLCPSARCIIDRALTRRCCKCVRLRASKRRRYPSSYGNIDTRPCSYRGYYCQQYCCISRLLIPQYESPLYNYKYQVIRCVI